MSKSLLNEESKIDMNVSEVANFPFLHKRFPQHLKEFNEQVLDSEGMPFGQIVVYSNTDETQFVMILYVPDSRPGLIVSDVSTLALDMIKMAEKLKTEYDTVQIPWNKRTLHLLEFIMPKNIEVSLLFNLKALLKLQFNSISGSTTTVFNPDVNFHGDPIALIAKLVKVGYFKGIDAGRAGFERKISSKKPESKVTGEQFGEEFL